MEKNLLNKVFYDELASDYDSMISFEKAVDNPEVMMRYFSAIMDGIQFHIMLDPKTFPAEEVKKLLIKQFA